MAVRPTRVTLAAAAVATLLMSACATGGDTGGSSSSTSSSGGGSTTSSAGGGATYTGKAGGAGGDVGVFTWWAAGSEKTGLDALVKLFGEKYPNDKFINLAVAGGAGSNAKAKLASDLANKQPPGSFQGHAGAELTDYIAAGQIQPVNDVINALGGSSVFPQNLLDLLTVKGNIYSVPSNIHRANVVWANPKVLSKAGITAVPKDIKSWIADMDKVKKSGVTTPITVGGTWTQVQLLENVLISDLGPDAYKGLFDGSTKWDSDGVKTAVNDYKTILTYANNASDGDDWPAATDAVIDGKAAYNLMGDWAVAEFAAKKSEPNTGWTWFPTPGQEQVFDFLADSFTLPTGTKNPDGTKDWLLLVGGAEGQKAFNLAKGSIPARTDVPPSDFPEYQQKAMEAFKSDKIVSSIAHGAAVSLAWNTDISTAVSKFHASRDAATLVSDLAAAATKNMK